MMSQPEKRIAMGFEGAAKTVGLSIRTLRYAAENPDPNQRLKTVRVGGRRLIRTTDLEDWFNRVAREEPEAA